MQPAIDYAIVLAGGSGTRFWPKSRAARPKQFLAFGGGGTLLAATLERTAAVAPPERTFVITGQTHVALAAEQAPNVPPSQLIGEPAARDTAAAVGLAATLVAARDRSASMLVCPADHRIATTAQFATAANAAAALLAEEPRRIIVFGIAPTSPATGYGYVERGAALGAREGLTCFDVARFHEKPPLERAREYVAGGRCYWNAGIFAFRAATMLAEIARQMPELARGLAEIGADIGTPRFAATLARVFPTLPKMAIDHAVMEGAERRAVVVPAYAWDDVGSFLALGRASAADGGGNVVLVQLLAQDSRNNIVDAGDGLVALIGVEDLVVVRTEDVTLVCPKSRSEEVKQLLDQLKSRGGETGRFL